MLRTTSLLLAVVLVVCFSSCISALTRERDNYVDTKRTFQYRGCPYGCTVSWCKPMPPYKSPPTPETLLFYPFWAPAGSWRELLDRPGVKFIATDHPTIEPEMVCRAHSRGIRVLLLVNIVQDRLLDARARENWAYNMAFEIRAKHLDGINIDIENNERTDRKAALTELTRLTRWHMDRWASTKDNVLSWSIAAGTSYWSRFYDYRGLAQYTDFFVMMLYDTNWNTPVAKGNIPINVMRDSIQNFKASFNIGADQVMAGLPFYGWEYKCRAGTSSTAAQCPLAGRFGDNARQIAYTTLMNDRMKTATTSVRLDAGAQDAWFNFRKDGAIWQARFDTPATIEAKRKVACTFTSKMAMWATTHVAPAPDRTTDAFYKALSCPAGGWKGRFGISGDESASSRTTVSFLLLGLVATIAVAFAL